MRDRGKRQAQARVLTGGLWLAIVGSTVLAVPSAQGATAPLPCPNEAFRGSTEASVNLPDCRAYEQATPVDKNGANVAGDINVVQASKSGGRITFFQASGLPTSGGSSKPPVYVASRGVGAWSSDGVLPLGNPGEPLETLGWDEEISTTVSAHPSIPGALYLGDTATGTFQLVFSAAPGNLRSPFLADFADGSSHIVFAMESESMLRSGAAEEKTNLYDFNDGTLSLVGRIPVAPDISCDDGGTPTCVPALAGAFAGSYDIESGDTSRGGASVNYYTQGTVSEDGAKIFFTAGGSGQLYMRKNGTSTVQISASKATVPDPNGPQPAAFVAATPSGSKVFFTSPEELTDEANTGTADQGNDLYVYDTESGELSDIAPDPTDADGADVVGVAGVSEDGSDVYFVANGVLASGASSGDCQGSAGGSGICNLYVSHAGETTFIAPIDATTSDYDNRIPNFESQRFFRRESRVAADGTLLFASNENLLGYDNIRPGGGSCPGSRAAGGRCVELYRYTPDDEELTCVSCDPSGVPPTGSATPETRRQTAVPVRPNSTLITRNISSNGKRAFFDSPDPLVDADVNGVVDPYEWEAPGEGSCTSESPSFSSQNGGCLYLLSTGTSPEPSYLGDISSTGDDAFIFTNQSLVPADDDELTDVYDVRVGGGLTSQHENSIRSICVSVDGCWGASPSAPGDSTAGTSTFNGPGNQIPKSPCKKSGKKQGGKKSGKKQAGKKKCKKKNSKSKPKKSRAAHANRGGSK